MIATEPMFRHELVMLMQHKPRPPLRRHAFDPRLDLSHRRGWLPQMIAFETSEKQPSEHRVLARLVALGTDDDQAHQEIPTPKRLNAQKDSNFIRKNEYDLAMGAGLEFECSALTIFVPSSALGGADDEHAIPIGEGVR